MRAALHLLPKARAVAITLTLCCGIGASGCARLPLGKRANPAPESESAARFPRDAARFALLPVTDSTVSFLPAEARWVRTGAEGVAVDPARGDALIARVRVMAISDTAAVALVTGQTSRIDAGHVLLLIQPNVPWWRERTFWWGVLSGVTSVGAFVAFL